MVPQMFARRPQAQTPGPATGPRTNVSHNDKKRSESVHDSYAFVLPPRQGARRRTCTRRKETDADRVDSRGRSLQQGSVAMTIPEAQPKDRKPVPTPGFDHGTIKGKIYRCADQARPHRNRIFPRSHERRTPPPSRQSQTSCTVVSVGVGALDRPARWYIDEIGTGENLRAVHEPNRHVAGRATPQNVGIAVAVEVAGADDGPAGRHVDEIRAGDDLRTVHEPNRHVAARATPENVGGAGAAEVTDSGYRPAGWYIADIRRCEDLAPICLPDRHVAGG